MVLTAEVDSAYYRLHLQDSVDSWFKQRGFDVTQPTISKEEFEKQLADHRKALKQGLVDWSPAAKLLAASAKEIADFVRNYIKDNPTTASQSGCRAKWKPLHGAHRRDELDAEWRKQAKPKGFLRERGQRVKIAKS